MSSFLRATLKPTKFQMLRIRRFRYQTYLQSPAQINGDEKPQVVQVPAPKKPLWQRVKEEVRHYWDGTKLLATETKISTRLTFKLLKGQQLTRREYRQLKRTAGDLLRVVPLIVIVLVPMLEFALPVLLKLFPNMLPSTFESKYQEEERKRNLLKLRIKMAKFLQETAGEVALAGSSTKDAAKELNEFFQKCRTSGEQANAQDILAIARRFQDELTLTNLSRPQLVHLARYMSLGAFGTDSFLRYQIERKIAEIKADDKLISSEGVDSLNVPELQSACAARGIAAYGVSPARMRTELQKWLELHLEHKIPTSLLILSHAFQTSTRTLPSRDALESTAEALQATLTSLPHQVINEASLKASETEGIATAKQKLDVLKEQEELIADELEEEEAQKEIIKSKEVQQKKESEVGEDTENQASTKLSSTSESLLVSDVITTPSAPSQPSQAKPQSASTTTRAEDDDGQLSNEELTRIADALKTISTDSALSDVKETFKELKENRQSYIQDVEEYKQLTQKEPPTTSELFGSRVDKMISKIEEELIKYDSEIGTKLNLVTPNLDGQISIQDLENTLRIIKDHPEDSRIAKIVAKLDSDNDGLVTMNEILFLAQEKQGHGSIVDKTKQPNIEKEKPSEINEKVDSKSQT